MASSGLAGLFDLPSITKAITASTTTPPPIPAISPIGGPPFFLPGLVTCRPCAPAISSAVVGLRPPLPPSSFSAGGLNFSPGAQKRNLRCPSSMMSPGLTLETAYSSPFTRTPLALLLSSTFHWPWSSTKRACCRETDWWSTTRSFSSVRPNLTSVRVR